MVDPQVISEWLKKADEDFEFAVSVIDESTFYAQICFHFHQAAEKYLKSAIVGWGLEFKRVHDLPVLLEFCFANPIRGFHRGSLHFAPCPTLRGVMIHSGDSAGIPLYKKSAVPGEIDAVTAQRISPG